MPGSSTVTGEAAAESSATVTGAFRGDERIAVRGVAALKAGLPVEVPALTLNRLCGSGFQAIVNGAQVKT